MAAAGAGAVLDVRGRDPLPLARSPAEAPAAAPPFGKAQG